MQILFDYIDLKITSEEFAKAIIDNRSIMPFLQSLVISTDENNIFYENVTDVQPFKECGFRFDNYINVYGFDSFVGRASIYQLIYEVLKYSYPKIKYHSNYLDDLVFFYTIIPDYIGGAEANLFIEEVIISDNIELFIKRKAKILKQKIREAFYLVDSKRPHWPQSAEWPFINGKPLKFIAQKNNQDIVFLYFQNEKSEVVEIEQSH